jgi:hypothetical protein
VFDRAVSVGSELEPGKCADKNYVWLSEWQLENINNNHLLPVDFETYRKLKNHISKALAPLLQVWLYASRQDGYFEKRYDELCIILNVTQYRHLSQIKRKLRPSLDELQSYGYLARWDVATTANDRAFKVVFYHGQRFLSGAERLAETCEQPAGNDTKDGPEKKNEKSLITELTKRGVSGNSARKLLTELPENRHEALRLVEWADQEIARKNPSNPAGFLVHMIREKVRPPDTFLSSSQMERLAQEDEAERLRQEKLAGLHADYERYRDVEVQKFIDMLSEAEYLKRIKEKKEELRARFDLFSRSPADTLHQSAEQSLRRDIEKELALATFEEFHQTRSLPPE